MRLNEQAMHADGTLKKEVNARELPRQIIFVSKADWDHSLWTNDQHTALRLAERGFQVLYVESLGLRQPALRTRDIKRIGRRLLYGIRGLRQVREGLWVFSPLVVPFHHYDTARRLNRGILGASLRFMLRRLRFRDPILWTYNPLMSFLAETLRASFLVYHCVDDLSAVPGIPTDIVLEADRSMASSADVIFTTSKPLLKSFLTLGSHSIYYFPNVADFEHFSRARSEGPIPHDIESIPAPRIGFVGAVSPYKLDFDLVAGVAERRPDWHWVFIGPWGTEESMAAPARLAIPNVHMLGHRDYDTLPDYMRGFDVAVLPCRINTYTRSMFPLKFFEYLAAGKPVVSTPLEALEDFSGSFIAADSTEGFCEAIEEILAGNRPDADFCLTLAQEHTWDKRLDSMLNVLEEVWRSRVQDPSGSPEENFERLQ